MEESHPNLEIKLRQQIQFYFSSANLLTDPYLNKLIKDSRNLWLPIKHLCNFPQTRTLLAKLNIELKQRVKKISKVLSNSQILRVNNFRVKRKIRFNAKSEGKKLIYVQSIDQATIQNLQKQVLKSSRQNNISLSSKKGKNWIVIIPQTIGETEQLQRYIRTNANSLSISRVLNSQQWEVQSKRYQNIVRKIQKLRQNRNIATSNWKMIEEYNK